MFLIQAAIALFNVVLILYFFGAKRKDADQNRKLGADLFWYQEWLLRPYQASLTQFFSKSIDAIDQLEEQLKTASGPRRDVVSRKATQMFNRELAGISQPFVNQLRAIEPDLGKGIDDLFVKLQDDIADGIAGSEQPSRLRRVVRQAEVTVVSELHRHHLEKARSA